MQRPAVEFDHEAHTNGSRGRGLRRPATASATPDSIPTLAATADIERSGRADGCLPRSLHGLPQGADAQSATSGPSPAASATSTWQPGESPASGHGLRLLAARASRHAFRRQVRDLPPRLRRSDQDAGLREGQGGGLPRLPRRLRRGRTTLAAQRVAPRMRGLPPDTERRAADSGPVLCVGCHDATAPKLDQAARGRAAPRCEASRTLSGSPTRAVRCRRWCPSTTSATSRQAQSCSELPPQNLLKRAPSATRSAASRRAAAWIPREAFHRTPAAPSCVGCHRKQAMAAGCAGCHQASAPTSPSKPACSLPRGPRLRRRTRCTAATSGPTTPASSPCRQPPTTSRRGRHRRAGRSHTSRRSCPTARSSSGSTLPFGRARLAGRFHGNVEALCAGCHHHSQPVGERPPPCRSCHAPKAACNPRTGRA